MAPERGTSKPIDPIQPGNALTRGADILRHHIALCREYLALVERENHALHQPDAFEPSDFNQARQSLLPRLDASHHQLKEFRLAWQELTEDQRQRHGDVATLIRQAQDLGMKILVLDRENEQHMLRRGLVPPHQLPSANRQRPNFIADLYKRSSTKE